MKDRDYFRDMDFTHRGSIEAEECHDRWVKKHGPELAIREAIRKLYDGGLAKQRIYFTLVEKMKKVWPYNNSQTLKNIIEAECKSVDELKASKSNKQQDDDFEDR